MARSGILAVLAGSSPVSAPHHFFRRTLCYNQNRPSKYLPEKNRQSHPPERAVQLPKELSQEEFANFADGDDSFYNDLGLESFDASKTLVDALGLDPSPPPPPPPLVPPTETSARPTATVTDAKGRDG